MSKKAVKFGSFLQCLVHIFPGHDSCFSNQFKDFVEPYEKISSKAWSMWQHYIPQHIFFRKLKVIIIKPSPRWQQDSLLLVGLGIYPQVSIIEIHVLQCLFVRGSDKKQMRGRIISNFTKGETLSCLISTKW